MSTDATLVRTGTSARKRRFAGKPIRDRVGDWIFPPKGPETAPVSLSQRRVYILPTNAGLLFGMTLLLMLIGSINYNLSLGYGLTFLLTGTGIVCILHTWRNLAHLLLAPGKSEPVFAGDRARFTILAKNPGRIGRYSVAIQFSDKEASYFDVGPGWEATVRIRIPATRRGLLRPGRFRIFTTYPLGLFYAWANVELDMSCLVYPAPETDFVSVPEQQASGGIGNATGKGDDDFAGLRRYYPGDSPRHIAWKAFAHTGIYTTKLFSGSAGTDLWFDLADTPESLGIERRLSRLTRWIMDASNNGRRYGLRLPDTRISLGAGDAHQARCLEALALFDAPSISGLSDSGAR
jgi:uncharacterized protein (DUF58 family)